eukprot:scaffold92827_cov28-Prasinocladus_malaysianus.AAC.1
MTGQALTCPGVGSPDLGLEWGPLPAVCLPYSNRVLVLSILGPGYSDLRVRYEYQNQNKTNTSTSTFPFHGKTWAGQTKLYRT